MVALVTEARPLHCNLPNAQLRTHIAVATVGARFTTKEIPMKYGIAWLVGVPPILIAGWFLLNHC